MDEQKRTDTNHAVVVSKPAPEFAVRTVKSVVGESYSIGAETVVRVDVPKVTRQHHRFMVAENEMNMATGVTGLSFESADEPQKFGHAVAPVDDVTVQDQMTITPGPVSGTVDDAVSREKGEKRVVVSLEIADRENPPGNGKRRRGTHRVGLDSDHGNGSTGRGKFITIGKAGVFGSNHLTIHDGDHGRTGGILPDQMGTVLNRFRTVTETLHRGDVSNSVLKVVADSHQVAEHRDHGTVDGGDPGDRILGVRSDHVVLSIDPPHPGTLGTARVE